jgi:type I restriction enzyme S subunit
MIEDLKSYPEYMDSGLPWLGEVPVHWEIRPASGAFSPIRERNTGMKEKIILSLSYGRIVVKPAGKLHGLVPESFDTYQIVNPGVTVIRTTDLQNDKTSLRTGIVRDRGIITSAYLALSTSDGLLPEFGYQILNAWDITKAIYGYGSGLRQNLDFSDFRRMPVAVPPIAEQAFIARFLAWATNCLDRAIGAKRRIIALLQEQKQAIIHRAVTRGLDPSVPLKDSGIPWLGEIPEHWEVRRAKQLCLDIVDCKNRTPELVEGGEFSVVRTTNIRNGTFNLKGSYSTDRRNFEIWTQRGVPKLGDVFFTREAPVGEACLVPNRMDLCLGQRMMYFRPNPDVLDAGFMLNSIYGPVVRKYIKIQVNGSTVGHLRLGQVSALPLLWCPVAEQKAIVAHIEKLYAPMAIAISRLEQEITFLREYRTRLIADVVTGKLDVREVAAGLPEEELQDQPDVAAGFDADEAEDDAESDLIDTAED